MKDPQEEEILRYGQDYVYFRRKLKELSGVDLADYKDQQMHRRLDSFRRRKGVPDFFVFARTLQRDPEKLREVLDFLTINVSEFFRNPDQWKVLRERILPQVVGSLPIMEGITAWSAGCSGGHEPYSLALLLAKDYPGRRHTILATDIDEESLQKGKAGRYGESETGAVPAELKERFFVRSGNGWEVSAGIKNMVSFRRHDLLRDEYPTGFDLVLCRNVIIYFKDHGKEKVLRGLASSVRPGGFLFSGATEAILSPASYGLRQECPLFYRKVETDPAAAKDAGSRRVAGC